MPIWEELTMSFRNKQYLKHFHNNRVHPDLGLRKPSSPSDLFHVLEERRTRSLRRQP